MNPPDWYWSNGLHDAKIVSVSVKESPCHPLDRCLIFKIDGDGTMFETTVREIRFYNFKILTIDFNIDSLNEGWWLSDTLTQKGERYILDLRFDTKKCKTKRLELKFQRAEVLYDR